MTQSEWCGMLLGLFLTLGVFSYLLGDNALFRFVLHLFIGVAAAFVAAIAWKYVVLPQLIQPFLAGNWVVRLELSIPLVLGGVMIARIFPSSKNLGAPAMAVLVGTGAAVAIGGAVIGTLITQVQATIQIFDPVTKVAWIAEAWVLAMNSSLGLIGTLATFLSFHYLSRMRSGDSGSASRWWGRIVLTGRFYSVIALGALFAGVLTSSLAALLDRVKFFIEFFQQLSDWSKVLLK